MASRVLRSPAYTALPLRAENAEPIVVRRAGGVLVFAIAALTAAEVDLGFFGVAFAGELLALALLPLAVMGWRLILSERAVVSLIVAGGVWVISLGATDLWRGTAANVSVKGLAEVAVPMVMIGIIWVLVAQYPHRIVYGILGIAAAYATRLTLFPNEPEAATPWRLGGTLVVTVAVLVLLTLGRSRPPRWVLVAVPVALGLWSFALGARGGGTILIAAGMFVAWVGFLRRWPSGVLSARQIAGGVLVGAVVAASVAGAYSAAARSGVLGERQTARYENQSSGSLGIVAGGRVAVAASLLYIADNPIVGIGSAAGRLRFDDWAERTALFFEARGYDSRRLFIQPKGIFDHSFVLGAWVSAGILSLAFWVVVAMLVLRALREIMKLEPLVQLLVAWVGFTIAWDMAFTPFGGRGRVLLPIMLLALLTLPRLRLRYQAGTAA